MTILVTGATGTIGTRVVASLAQHGADVRALVRDEAKARVPDGVGLVKRDLLDVDSMRAALAGVSTLFLLNAVTPDELTQALITLNLAREAGIERIVYFSVIHSDIYVNVPHFAAKHAVERMIETMGFNATVLRPAYFINNDGSIKDVVLGHGVYPMPVGDKGLAMVDVRDIGDVAALELLRRERAADPLPLDTLDVVGPESLTGEGIAAIWSEVLARPIAYAGGDTAAFEQSMRQFAPAWMAYDMRMMADRFQSNGMTPRAGDVDRLVTMLRRKLRTYADFAREVATGSDAA